MAKFLQASLIVIGILAVARLCDQKLASLYIRKGRLLLGLSVGLITAGACLVLTLQNVSAGAGPVFTRKLAARGLAVGDFDNDGAVDVLVAVNNGAPLLLKNLAAQGNHWLGIRLVGKRCNPDAVGARITWQAGDLKRHQLKTDGGSYLASHDPRVVLGIGTRTKIDRLEIRWPQPIGRVETFTDLPIDRYITIVEGVGIKP